LLRDIERRESVSEEKELTGPNLNEGIPENELAPGKMIVGHASGEAVLLARSGDEFFAASASCTHYGGPLAEGLLLGEFVRCPWHHARFDLRTGAAIAAPALNDLSCWIVERRDGRVFVGGKRESGKPAPASRVPRALTPIRRIAIIGAGAAGNAAAEMLRREAFDGTITVFDQDSDAPYDRPNLSKDYLAGNAPEEWIPLHPQDFYAQQGITLRLGETVDSIDVGARRLRLLSDESIEYDALLLATGASPIHLDIPVTDGATIHYLRTLADSRAIIRSADGKKSAVVIGASFIGLETAASLRTRGLDVHVVAPEKLPLERIMGPQLGEFIKRVHEGKGVAFHLGQTVTSIAGSDVTLSGGEHVEADLVVAGVGVRPNVGLAEKAGLALDRGVMVNQLLETSSSGVFAAGDIARWPDPHSGKSIRVEHWVVAERQGQIAARNILGQQIPFDHVPFFWSNHYDVPIGYTGHAEGWDDIVVAGDPDAGDCAVRYQLGGRTIAIATIGRDRENLEMERDMELQLRTAN
jgi:NADPH-dependent 2,4-dienoyl-CoA reductase/sulfur reductase-like enzyme/nitrite reductase/ring-hydroxylating ferredoxin subunit